jgi:protocatechuate 3,4-dioxygenase beta subunit
MKIRSFSICAAGKQKGQERQKGQKVLFAFFVLFVLFVSLFITPACVWAQSAPAQANKATASVAGRIMIGDQPAAGVEVMLRASSGGAVMISIGSEQQPPITGVTDADGRYKLTGLAAGAYRIAAYAPAYVVAGEARSPFESGKAINVAEGEAVENVDFSLTRGAVVTGKVTNPDGRPVMGERVTAYKLDANGKRQRQVMPGLAGWETDDRGIYRIFGLEPGRYVVGAGASSDETMIRGLGGGTGGFYKQTFHPEATDETQAKVLDLSPGVEVENVDIKLARATKGFVATGRVIEAETSKPVPGVMIGYGVMKQGTSSIGMGSAATNSQGEFRLEGLTPNSYQAFAVNLGQSDLYADPVKFDVVVGDVTNLQIRMSRGASISGTAVVEGTRDPKVLADLSKIQLQAIGASPEQMVMSGLGGSGSIAPNGQFRLSGVRPGKTRVIAQTFNAPKGFTLARVEHNGAEVKEFDVQSGEQITGVRLVFAFGTGVLVGRVEVRGGSLPQATRLIVFVSREGDSSDTLASAMGGKIAQVDERGQFVLEGLAQGNYRVRLQAAGLSPENMPKLPKVEQAVAITGAGRHEVVLMLDLSKEEK